ncbi:MAG: aminotransferase class IV [Candidatus Omnitrophota bacterium]
MKETIFFNNRFLPMREGKISISCPGFLHGLGLFETMRAYGGKIAYLDKHLKRVKHSSKFIHLTFGYSTDRLKNIIKQAVKINGFKDAYLRLTVFEAEHGTDLLVTVKNYHPHSAKKYKMGFSAKISSLRQDENSFLSRIKTTNRILYETSFKEAKNKGFDEAIILNSRGYIAEASRSNIFLVQNKEIFTPSLGCGCLAGITRQAILSLAKKNDLRIFESNLTIQDLLGADEAFLTNSLIGIMPLTSLEKHKIGKKGNNRITEFLIEKYAKR